MTRKEFEAYRLSVEKEQFTKHTADPLDYGVQRIEFRRQKLKKLINAGKNIDSRTIQAKIVRWKRQLDRLDKSETRLKSLMNDLTTNKLTIPTLALRKELPSVGFTSPERSGSRAPTP